MVCLRMSYQFGYAFSAMKLKKAKIIVARRSRLRVVEVSRLASFLSQRNHEHLAKSFGARKLSSPLPLFPPLQKNNLPVCLFSSSHFRDLSRSFALFRD